MGESILGLNIALLGIGFVSGVSSSAPIGPINLWVINAALNDYCETVWYFVAGVIVADVVFAAIAIFSYYGAIERFRVDPWVEGLGGCFIFALGVIGLKKAGGKNPIIHQPSPKKEKTRDKWSSFIMGVTLCGANPAFLMFWVFVINAAREKLHFDLSVLNASGFLLGVVIGDLSWFKLIIYGVQKRLKQSGTSLIKTIRIGIAVGFMVLGGVTVFNSFDAYMG